MIKFATFSPFHGKGEEIVREKREKREKSEKAAPHDLTAPTSESLSPQ